MPTAFERWLLRDGYADRTVRQYTGAIKRAERWLSNQEEPPLRQATWDHVRAYVEMVMPVGAVARREAFRSALKVYWRYLRRKDCPLTAVRVPRRRKGRSRALEEGLVDKILLSAEQVGPRPYAVVCACYYAGLRASEVTLLTWPMISREWLVLVGKGFKEAELPMHPQLWEALDRLPRVSDWVFPGRYPGTHIAYNTVREWVRLAGAAAGVHLEGAHPWPTPHVIRHSAITELNDRTKDLRAAQEFARHDDPKTTTLYTRMRDRRLREAMSVL